MSLAENRLFDNGWEALRDNPLYQQYTLPAHAQAWLAQVRRRAGCFLVEGDAQKGKTALVRYLWQLLADEGYRVIGYIFERERRNQVDEAIRQIRRDLQGLGLFDGRAPDTLSIPWLAIDTAAQRMGPIAVLIDGVDECAPEQWPLLGALLPSFPLSATRLVVTSRQPLHTYSPMIASTLISAEILRLADLEPADTLALARQFLLAHPERLAPRIHGRAEGRAALIAAILRSTDPESVLRDPAADVEGLKRIAAHELREMQRLAGSARATLLGDLLALLTVAPAPLSFDELRTILGFASAPEPLWGLCELLKRYIRAGDSYQIGSPDVRAHLLADEIGGGRYAAEIRAMRPRLAQWYRDHYTQAPGALSRLPAHVLRHAPRFLLDAATADAFGGERIFVDRSWRDAIDNRFETIATLREMVEEAWRAAERSDHLATQVLGVTTCAVMLTSLRAVFPPEIVIDLLRRELISEPQARAYGRAYPSARERDRLSQLLRADAPAPPAHALSAAFDRLALYPPHERQWRLSRLHRGHAAVGTAKLTTLLSTLRSEQRAPMNNGALHTSPPLPALIEGLRVAMLSNDQPAALETLAADAYAPLGLAAQQGLSGDQADLLSEIAAAWAADEFDNAGYYAAITRAIASSTRAVYFDGLATLAPAIGRVFGAAYLGKIHQIVSDLTRVYP